MKGPRHQRRSFCNCLLTERLESDNLAQTFHDISVIICAYTEDRWNDLVAAIRSVQQQTLPPREIIVVIDHNPGLLKRVQECVPGVIVIENQEAKGLSGARNSGAAVAQQPVVAFPDDDAIAEPNWIERLMAHYTDSIVIGVGGKIEPLWDGKRPSWFPEEFNWAVGCTYQGMPTEGTSVRNVIGANMSMWRKAMHLITTRKLESSTITCQVPEHVPVRILEIELGQPLPTIYAIDDQTGHCYKRAMCLVRLHSRPLGSIGLQLNKSEMSAYEYTQNTWHYLGQEINEHLQQDGLSPVTELSTAGLCSPVPPRCIKERGRFLTEVPFASVIVPTHDRPEQLERCLRSLVSLQYPHYEVIVVDNAPTTDATAVLIQQAYRDMPWVRYIREDRPGASWARNRGIAAAKGEILTFTDDDVVVDTYWLLELVRAFSVAEDVACVTGLVMPLELETPAQVWFEEYGGFSKGFTRRIFDMTDHHPKTPLHPYTAGQFGSGVSAAFTAAFLRGVGGFDPALGPGDRTQAGEDLALFFQAVIGGHKLVYTPDALLYHLHRRDEASLHRQMYNYGVGLTAYLTKSLLDNPRLLLNLITKVPYGLYFTLSARSPKNRKKSMHYPKELTRLELKGMVYGPFAYIRSRWATRNARKALRKSAGQERVGQTPPLPLLDEEA